MCKPLRPCDYPRWVAQRYMHGYYANLWKQVRMLPHVTWRAVWSLPWL